ncbi:50S ribosomal protein L33 [Mycoplasma tauri]|uniref:Large ribosomal subunit protein bL33 n=1 Tax=Mycoplasma tauri TaxID=547987 RepID=A0A953NG70_9MOLU|nr:50S ribosomal protein L33 [Mycoplasma tauri]MBZ4195459.1 50S ribosomal protein L33 [Mycoplasma tauri]MBZ4203861.1 50S ribosomal protein L33 [Mycoplasma tauri]MBZ4203983.1 50S ribosomal protein L33 [Mycoplasma tauri]MBZ4212801.1 50S ribosomal protein L33 [Mycoplasma tauri]MBZ4218476.1 50S ribosomal protein L33 [Mycoplasma tauri]
MFRKKVTLGCEKCFSLNYSIKKSIGNENRLILKKFCPKCNEHTMHKEEK